MSMSDPIADMLTRIRNAQMVNKNVCHALHIAVREARAMWGGDDVW